MSEIRFSSDNDKQFELIQDGRHDLSHECEMVVALTGFLPR